MILTTFFFFFHLLLQGGQGRKTEEKNCEVFFVQLLGFFFPTLALPKVSFFL